MGLLISLIVNGAIVYLVTMFTPNVHVNGFFDAVLVGAVLGLINTFIRPIIATLAMPVTVATLGLFSLVINGLMVLGTDYLLDGFRVNGFLWAVIFSAVLSAANSVVGIARN